MFLLLFSIIDLYFLIPAVIGKNFNATVEFAMPAGTPSNDANTEIETQPLTAETKKKRFFKVN